MNMRSYKCCRSSSLESAKITQLSALLTLVSEKSRLRLLCLLREGEHCVCEIMEHVDMSQSLISHHLRDLKELGLIADEKRGLYVFYSLTPRGKEITNLLFKIKL